MVAVATAGLHGLPGMMPVSAKEPQGARASAFKVGDRAIWEFAGKEHAGTVESINSTNGWVTLKLDDGEFGGQKFGPLSRFPQDFHGRVEN